MKNIHLVISTLFFCCNSILQSVTQYTSRFSTLKPWLVVIPLGILAGCCGKVDTIVLLQDPDGNVGKLEVAGEGGKIVIDKAGYSTKLTNARPTPSPSRKMSQEELTTLFEDALAAEPQPPTKFILYFQSGSALLDAKSITLLEEIHTTIQQKKSQDISIIGHTDTLGNTEYNRHLSHKRAEIVKHFLEAKGITPNSMEMSFHGEKNLLIITPDNTPERQNRRVEVTVR